MKHVVFCGLMAFSVSAMAQPTALVKHRQNDNATLTEALNPDGTLRHGISGSFNATGFWMTTVSDGKPVFRIAGPGDQYWQSGFGATGGVDGSIVAVAVSGNDVYVGGNFTQAGGVAANNIAKWNGSTWSALGTGVNDWVRALAVRGTDVYAGGDFTQAGGITASRIAKWNGNVCSSLVAGSYEGCGGPVYALALSGSNLYVGGNFWTAGGASASRIAKWNGSAWSAMINVIPAANNVHALAATGLDLYVGADSWSNYTMPAWWNGTRWGNVGTGVTGGPVYALAVSGSDLYVGGDFTQAGGITGTSRLAKWDGSNWSAVGSGVTNTVYALAVNGSDVYVGGRFSQVGGVPGTSRIAKWNGSTWSSLGTGVNNVVRALALSAGGTKLYVGGDFTAVGDGSLPMNYFGVYDIQRANGLSDELATPTTFFVYPNPASASDRVHLKTDRPQCRLRLLDPLGRVLHEQTADANGEAQLDVSKLAAGLYFVQAGTAVRRLVVE